MERDGLVVFTWDLGTRRDTGFRARTGRGVARTGGRGVGPAERLRTPHRRRPTAAPAGPHLLNEGVRHELTTQRTGRDGAGSGTAFEGRAWGAPGTAFGEAVSPPA
ncbi:hypothetical protein QJS66_03950 [Kocuria rhizophila]|nr:hypothetical protein QJS66_03950 [Kocuria rhizophila]